LTVKRFSLGPRCDINSRSPSRNVTAQKVCNPLSNCGLGIIASPF
jgi:hypothetical protein